MTLPVFLRNEDMNVEDGICENDRLFEIVKREVDKWNPYGLLPDAPSIEFDGKSERIAKMISFESSVYEIAQATSNVFSDSFEPEYFTVDLCMGIAENIKKALMLEKISRVDTVADDGIYCVPFEDDAYDVKSATEEFFKKRRKERRV